MPNNSNPEKLTELAREIQKHAELIGSKDVILSADNLVKSVESYRNGTARTHNVHKSIRGLMGVMTKLKSNRGLIVDVVIKLIIEFLFYLAFHG